MDVAVEIEARAVAKRPRSLAQIDAVALMAKLLPPARDAAAAAVELIVGEIGAVEAGPQSAARFPFAAGASSLARSAGGRIQRVAHLVDTLVRRTAASGKHTAGQNRSRCRSHDREVSTLRARETRLGLGGRSRKYEVTTGARIGSSRAAGGRTFGGGGIPMIRFVPIPESVAIAVRRERKDPFGNSGLSPIVVDKEESFPCRICLEDARIGETVFLFSYSPFGRPAPHQTLGPVYVHAGACTPFQPSPRLPEVLRRRLVALRAYDEEGTELVECDVLEGAALEERAQRALENHRARRVNVHFARPGCFACSIERHRA
jgi:hypothetical protein